MFKIFFIYFSFCLFLVPRCIYSLFGKNVTLEQILYHMSLGMNGVKGTDISIAIPVLNTVLLPLLFLIFYALFLKKNLFFRRIGTLMQSKKMIVVLFVFSVGYMCAKTNVADFVRLTFGKDYFSDVYSNPNKISFKNPTQKYNLLLIYVESLENNLTNKKIFNTNLIQPIDDLNGIKVPHLYPAPGTGWSIAGMMSSQCAVPLKLHFGYFPHKNGNFLPNLVCLGDILKNFGYKQYFLAGHDLGLSGTGNFYHNHGYDDSIGKKEWFDKNLPSTLFTGFGEGLHDDTLLNEAKKIIIANNNAHTNFNLTLITLDTHAKEGFPSPQCTHTEKTSGFRGVFQCSSSFVADFINDLESKHLLDNTVVVLMGDHPFMESPEKVGLFPNPRDVYMKLIYPDHTRLPMRDTMTHFDVAPTILDLMGFMNSSETKFGLGFSVFADTNKVDYAKHFATVTSKTILYHSSIYDSFW